MKLFQKSALAVAIAAVPFLSVNAMEALDDAALSEMTGQAGVTIETTVDNAGITIGSIEYTDVLVGTESASNIGGGSLVINKGDQAHGIQIQGQEWNGSAWVDGSSTTKQTIDIDSMGNLITETVAAGTGLGSNSVDTYNAGTWTAGTSVETTAQKINVGQVLLRGANQTSGGAQLVSNLSMLQESGNSSAHIINLSGANTVADYDALAHNIGGSNGLAKAEAMGANLAIVTKGSSRIADLSVDALDGAISITGLSYGGGENGDKLMESNQVIWAKGGNAYATQTDVDNATVPGSVTLGQNLGGGVYIQGSDAVGTLQIQNIAIGGGSIGQVAIRNISQSGSTMRIYGH